MSRTIKRDSRVPLGCDALRDEEDWLAPYRALRRHDWDVDLIFHGPIAGAGFRF